MDQARQRVTRDHVGSVELIRAAPAERACWWPVSSSRPVTSAPSGDLDPALGLVRVAPSAEAVATTPAHDTDADITRAFSTSVVVSGIRCLLAYIVFPWILPLLGLAKGVGPAIGLVVGMVAIAFNLASIRRFQRSGHRYRHWISAINVTVICMLVVLIVRDVVDLVG
jgi:hypothetical protein